MALIPKFHTLADHYAVAPAQEIIEGMWVTLNGSGQAVLADGAVLANFIIGVSGDTKSTSKSGLADTNNSSVGAFVNRVSDVFDETKASGRLTVYHSAGVFASNQFVAGAYAINDKLYVGTGANVGLLTNVAPAVGAQVVARLTAVPSPFDSGVPGTDTANGSLALLGSFMEFRLLNS